MQTLKSVLSLIFLFLLHSLYAQDTSLLSRLNDSLTSQKVRTFSSKTFSGIRLINMQTVEAPGSGALNFIIMHRFGRLNEGAYNFFGLDQANIRLGFDYGISSRFSIGIGRSSLNKTFDAYGKLKLLRQTDGSEKMPLTASLFESIGYFTLKDPTQSLNARLRTMYTSQLLIARKFNRNLSLEFVPTWQHFNLVPNTSDKNDVFIMGLGGRLKITKLMGIDAEYNYLFPNQVVSTKVYNSFSVGWDVETGGGHLFQLVFTNSQGMIESQNLSHTDGRWSKGDIYFGFNISRNFNLSKHAKKKW